MMIEIRKVEEDDYIGFNAFCYNMYSERSVCFPFLFELPPSTIVYTSKQFLSEINSNKEVNLIALSGEKIIGFIQADIKVEEETSFSDEYTYADIRNFYVLPTSDPEEILLKLYNEMERQAKKLNLDKIAVINYGELASDNFYLQQSFKPVSINYMKHVSA